MIANELNRIAIEPPDIAIIFIPDFAGVKEKIEGRGLGVGGGGDLSGARLWPFVWVLCLSSLWTRFADG